MKVQTVLGEIDAASMGRTLVHEHLYIAFPGSEFDHATEIDREDIIVQAVDRMVEIRDQWGVQTVVDPCPIELGRDVQLFAEISDRSGVHVVCTTGFYHEALGMPVYWRARRVEEITDLYVEELAKGVGKTGIRAGAIKLGTGQGAISPLETKFLEAACRAHLQTGVPLITHTQGGTCGPDQIEAFVRHGVQPHHCLIGHSCGTSDQKYQREIVKKGSYIGFDRIGYQYLLPDTTRADCLMALIEAGYSSQVMLSMDTPFVMRGKMPYQMPPELEKRFTDMRAAGDWPLRPSYLFTHFLPLLKERGMSEAQFYSLLDDNPRRFFESVPSPEPPKLPSEAGPSVNRTHA